MFEGKSKGFWTPNITLPMWNRAIDIDYDKLEREAQKLMKLLNKADKVHITTKKGTDLWISLKKRKAFADSLSDKRTGGGNMPTGEVFISPAVGSTNSCSANICQVYPIAGVSTNETTSTPSSSDSKLGSLINNSTIFFILYIL